MNHLPIVTIITVCLNAIKTLPETIKSVFIQNKEGFYIEHIIIDGGSTDGTLEFLEEQLRQGYISNYISEPDTGIYNAMNKGLFMASGTAINFLNADDAFVAPNVVKEMTAPIFSDEADLI